jgi:hypothetical protein
MRRHWPLMLLAALAGAALALLAACGAMAQQPTADRQGPNGTRADGSQDMTHVIVYRAPDLVPNVATMCLGNYGFASTLKTGSTNGGDTSPALVRFPEYDKVCAQ